MNRPPETSRRQTASYLTMQRLLAGWALAMALPGGLWVSAVEPRLALGVAMPPVTGDDLAGHSVTLPAAASGQVALVAFGFSYASRRPVEAWTEHVRDQWGAGSGFTWFQVPMIGGFARMAKPFITGGMKKETPAQYHGNAVTVFGGVGPWKTRLGVTNDSWAYLVLVDRAGTVRWLHAGPFDQARATDLDNQIRSLLADPPARMP